MWALPPSSEHRNVFLDVNSFCAQSTCTTDGNFSGEKAQDRLNHGSIPQISIEHGVVNGTVRPVGMEVFLDEGTTLVVNRVDDHFCISFRFGFRNKAVYLLSPVSIQKKAQCVAASAYEML